LPQTKPLPKILLSHPRFLIPLLFPILLPLIFSTNLQVSIARLIRIVRDLLGNEVAVSILDGGVLVLDGLAGRILFPETRLALALAWD
jgi:hypothetical protein